MKVSGFSFIRNAITYDYPIVESLRSILPICDELVVAVGNSDDDTRALIQSIDSKKIKIIDTVWDDSLRTGGQVLALETDKALAAIDPQCDWAFYIQGDEVIHEQFLPAVMAAMKENLDSPEVDGLLFKYLHFYGSYDYVGIASSWYRHEIRVIRPGRGIYSYKDAQGFRKGDNQKLRVIPIDAWIYHYGWVKEPAAMQRKQETFHALWHDNNWIEKNVLKADKYDYQAGIDALSKFEGTHPAVMIDRIHRKNWQFDYDISFNAISMKDRLKKFLAEKTGIELGYKNYQLLKK